MKSGKTEERGGLYGWLAAHVADLRSGRPAVGGLYGERFAVRAAGNMRGLRRLALSLAAVLLSAALGTACRQTYTPKPRTYIHIELPEKAYRVFDSTAYPFRFDLPVYAQFRPIKARTWADIEVPSLGATINFTYIARPNLDTCIRNSLFFVERNLSKANGLYENEIHRPEDRVYGYIYDLTGPEVATTCQFYLTDSNRHFVRGALYLNCVPNNDSLAPVLTFLRADIQRLVDTFEWK